MSKATYIIGTITIVGIVGITIYSIKKAKDLKDIEESSISAEEAREYVYDNSDGRDEDTRESFLQAAEVESMDELKDESHDFVSWNASFSPPEDDDDELPIKSYAEKDAEISRQAYEQRQKLIDDNEVLEDSEPGDSVLHDESYHIHGEGEMEDEGLHTAIYEDPTMDVNLNKEREELRHDPNTQAALNQYIDMELAEWRPDTDTYLTMRRLFQIDFLPETPGDHHLKTKLIDYRVQFFGYDSVYNKHIKMAEVILYYARMANYNVGESVGYWVDYFLEFNEFSHFIDGYTVGETITLVNKHVYHNQKTGTFGLFGLMPYHMEEALRIASRNPDQLVTYEMEFNEFLKSCL